MRLVYKAWRQYTERVMVFKSKVLINKVKAYFNQLKRRRELSSKARKYKAGLNLKTKYTVIYGFRMNADFYIGLRA